jgi:hypothetical protein
MYSLIDVDPKKEYGVVKLPEWKTVQDGLKRNLVAMLSHYRHASYSVAPDHLLVQLLQSINIPLSLNSDRYYSNVSISALQTANAFQLTTPFGAGKLFRGVFFSKSVQEVIIGFDESFNIDKVEAQWQDATPVRVLRHPFTNLNLQVPNGRYMSREVGLAVVAVNVSLLAVQYRAFRYAEQRKQNANPDYTQRNVQQFVHMYVLPNMLESYLDYALFNRIDALDRDAPVDNTPTREALHTPSHHPQVDVVYKRLLGMLDKVHYPVPALLAAIPSASHKDMRSVMFVPDVVPTRQILWSVILARLPMLLFLIRLAKKIERVQDQTGLADIAVTLKRLKSQRVLDSALPKELYQSAMDMIDEILISL